MNKKTLEERVALIEKTVAQLVDRLSGSESRRDWRSTVGMFADDPVFKEIIQEGRGIREADRRQTNA